MAVENLVNGPAFLSIGAQGSGGSLSNLGHAIGGVTLDRMVMQTPHFHDGFGTVPADVIVTGIMGVITLRLANLDYDVYESLINRASDANTSATPGYLLFKNSKGFRLGVTSPLLAKPYLFPFCWMESPSEVLGNDSFVPQIKINCIPYGATSPGNTISGEDLYTRVIA